MPDIVRRAPTVGIRPCTYGHRSRAWLARYRRADSKLQDLPLIIWQALLQRYAHNGAATVGRPDLEFVPWPCLLHARGAVAPRLGSFTLFSGAWSSFALELFDDSRAMCASSANCSSSRLRGIAVLAIESPSYLLSWQPPASEASMSASRLPAFPGSGNGTFQIPYPTSAHFDADRGMPEAPQLSKRTALVALVANLMIESKKRGAGEQRNSSSSSSSAGGRTFTIGRGPLRSMLHDECRKAPAGACIGRGGPRGGSMIWNMNNATFAAYQSAVFCLQPWGDSATRKGFWDAVQAGCINVVFNDAGWNETDSWFGDHREWTVRMPLTELSSARGALGFLRALPRAEVERLHAAVLNVRGRLQYAIDGGTPGGDGVDVIVRQVARHFARLRQARDLPRLHTGENACRTIIGHICKQVLPTVPRSVQ